MGWGLFLTQLLAANLLEIAGFHAIKILSAGQADT